MRKKYLLLALTGSFMVLIFLLKPKIHEWKTERERMLENMDILAHPERYPLPVKYFYDTSTKESHSGSSVTLTTYADRWREVLPDVFIFSAYKDVRSTSEGSVVRLVGLLHRRQFVDLKLQCAYRQNGTVEARDYAALTPFHEQHNSSYLGTFVFCLFRGVPTPAEVALMPVGNDSNPSWFEVHQDEPSRKGGTIHVCVKPIYGKGNDLFRLAEFLSYYSVVGIKWFTFYDYDVSESVKSYLRSIVSDELGIGLVDWTLPRHVAENIWQLGQLASIQDCLLRSRESQFVLMVDLDEYLVPRQHFSLKELTADLLKSSKRKIGSFIFRQSYFCRPNAVPENDVPLLISTWTSRESAVWPERRRSKFIARTEAVAEAGIHFVWKHWKGWKSATVPWQLAMIHHYNDQGCKPNSTVEEDRTAESFKVEILFSKPMIEYGKLPKEVPTR